MGALSPASAHHLSRVPFRYKRKPQRPEGKGKVFSLSHLSLFHRRRDVREGPRERGRAAGIGRGGRGRGQGRAVRAERDSTPAGGRKRIVRGLSLVGDRTQRLLLKGRV